MRIRGTSTKELEEAGEETDGLIENTSKLYSKVKALTAVGGQEGISILGDDGKYKSTYEIITAIAERWEEITAAGNDAALLEILAGKTRGSVVAALMEQPDVLKDAYEDAMNAEGSANKELETYLDSIQGRMDLFTNSVQTMWSNAVNSEFIKFIVDAGTALMSIIDSVGLLNSSLIALSAIIMIKNKMNLVEYFGSISNSILNIIPKLKGYAAGLLGVFTVSKTLTAEMIQQQVATKAITQMDAIRMATSKGLILSEVALTDAEAAHLMTATGVSNIEAQSIVTKLGLGDAAKTLTLTTLQEAVANKTLTASEATRLGIASGLIAASTSLTAAKATEILTSQGVAAAEAEEIVAALGLGKALTPVTVETISLAIANGALTPELGAVALGLLGVDVAAKGTTTSLGALWAAMWPLLAVMAAIAALVGIVKLFDSLIITTSEASEKLKETRQNLEDLESELKSLNTQIDETKEKIAELEALPSLSLVQQEELDELNATLDRLEQQKKIQQREIEVATTKSINDGVDVINSKFYGTGSDDFYDDDFSTGAIEEDAWHTYGQSGEDVIEIAFDAYEERQKKIEDINKKLFSETDVDAIESLREDRAALEYEMDEIATSIENFFADEDYNGWSYGMDEGIDKFLDDFYHLQDRWTQIYDSGSDKSDIIQSIFGRNPTKEIEGLERDIQEIMAGNGSWEDKNSDIVELLNNITNLDDGYQHLKLAIDDLGVSYQDIADYFTLQNGEFDSNNLEGIAGQYQKGISVLEQFKNAKTIAYINQDGSEEQIAWKDLFNLDDAKKEATANVDVIAKVLKGADEETRKQFGALVESVAEGNLNFEQAIESFGLSGAQRGLKLLEESVIEINTSIFKDLDDDLVGLIDTFEELGSSLESVASSFELVQQANKEMSHSGYVSLETAMQLIESTEDWNDVLTISNGVITLNEGATNSLVDAKLDQIRTNIEVEIQELETAHAQLVAAESGENLGTTLEESTNESIRQVAANLGYLTELLSAFSEGDFFNAFSRAEGAKAKSLEATKVAKSTTNTSMSRAEIEQKLNDAYARREMLEGVNGDNFEQKWDSSIVDGSGKDSKTEEIEDAFQKAMEYWENRIGANQAKYEQVQNEIDLLESQGKKAGVEYYQEQIKLEEERKSLLEQQEAEAKKMLSTFTEGSDQWWDAANTLNDIRGELDDVTASLQDLNDAMAEVNWYIFEETHERFSSLIDDLETIRDLISPNGEEDWFDDEGMWTDKGVASLATYVQALQMYQNALDETNAKLKEYNESYAGNEDYYKKLGIDSEQDLYDKREELIDQQYEYRTAIGDTQQSVSDMYESQIDSVEEYTNTLIESYNDYIDVVKEALDAERDLYEFKKDVQKQTKDIASLERRIASLSGSDNAADIAERRKLEAELAEAREGLNDTYYDHAKDAQSEALDKEAEAYENAMNKFIEGLRDALDTALLDMEGFMGLVANAVMTNAPAIKEQYEGLGLSLDSAIIDPWTEAANAIKTFGGAEGLGVMNSWVAEGGPIYNFDTNATKMLQEPWKAGTTALGTFTSSVTTSMNKVYTDVQSNVSKSAAELAKLKAEIDKINTTDVQTHTGNPTPQPIPPVPPLPPVQPPTPDTKKYLTATTKVQMSPTYTGNDGKIYYKVEGLSDKYVPKGATINKSGILWANEGSYVYTSEEKKLKKNTSLSNQSYHTGGSGGRYTMYAKGTTGTKRDEWAITDEPWLGDELTMYATPQGTLSYMRAGSTVVPADLTRELINIAELGVGGLTMPKFNSGVNIMSNAINKPELNISFDSMVHVDHCDEGTLKDLEKMVDIKINQFSKQMNYAIKKIGGR